MRRTTIDRCIEIIQKASTPLEPRTTDAEFRSDLEGGIKAVIFDVYGTLFISSSGDIGASADSIRAEAMREAFNALELVRGDYPFDEEGPGLYRSLIEEAHAESRRRGTDYPEVNILDIWDSLCTFLEKKNALFPSDHQETCPLLAVEFETRVNPVWPMTDLNSFFDTFKERGIPVGIVSNAQFYTPLLFPALTGRPWQEHGFRPDLTVWSWEEKRAKPSPLLFETVAERLKTQYGTERESILYVGNDMRNDILASSEAGLHTALFAGDKRSLRMRSRESCCTDLKPDAILTELEQILTVI